MLQESVEYKLNIQRFRFLLVFLVATIHVALLILKALYKPYEQGSAFWQIQRLIRPYNHIYTRTGIE